MLRFDGKMIGRKMRLYQITVESIVYDTQLYNVNA